jgi:hypothetical protein
MVYSVLSDHFVPGDSDSLTTPAAKAAVINLRRQLEERHYTPEEMEDLIYDAGVEVREVHAWLHVVNPGDFYRAEDFDD